MLYLSKSRQILTNSNCTWKSSLLPVNCKTVNVGKSLILLKMGEREDIRSFPLFWQTICYKTETTIHLFIIKRTRGTGMIGMQWIIFIGVAVVSWLVQMNLQSKFKKYSKIPQATE